MVRPARPRHNEFARIGGRAANTQIGKPSETDYWKARSILGAREVLRRVAGWKKSA
jgi:hypothetical protein